MTTVTISPKFQMVVPKEIRYQLALKPGQRIKAIAYDNRIELVLIRPIDDMRGSLPGIDTAMERDGDRA